MEMFNRILDWINVVLTPTVLFMYWPHLDKVGTLAFIIIPCWAGIYWITSIQNLLPKEEN